MQNTKDTFYEVIRGRLAEINPERKIVVRGVARPGLLVEENELAIVPVTPDCFRLRWTQMNVTTEGALPLVNLACEVQYETAGTALGGGLDRGRSIGTMDSELLAAVTTMPMRTTKMSYTAEASSGGSAKSLSSSIWWSAPVFGPAEVRGDRVRRIATINVMSYQEPQEAGVL